jgi:hypothetical protein
LPQRAPIEQGLKAVTTLGKGREINFLTVEPVSRVYYPGVLEERFQILAEGTFQRHLQFLEAFEECDVWADLTFLRLDQRAISAMGGAERRSEMTLSFYSALPSAELTTN